MSNDTSKTLFFTNGFTDSYPLDGYEFGFVVFSPQMRLGLSDLMRSKSTIVRVVENNDLKLESLNFECGSKFQPFYFDLNNINDHIDSGLYDRIETMETMEGFFWLDGVACLESGQYLSTLGTVQRAYCSTLILDGETFMWQSCTKNDPAYIESKWCHFKG